MTAWTQDEAIAFECAREAIGHHIAIYSARIADEAAKPCPDVALIEQLWAERASLHQERAGLHVGDHAAIEQARAVHGAAVRAWREGEQCR